MEDREEVVTCVSGVLEAARTSVLLTGDNYPVTALDPNNQSLCPAAPQSWLDPQQTHTAPSERRAAPAQ